MIGGTHMLRETEKISQALRDFGDFSPIRRTLLTTSSQAVLVLSRNLSSSEGKTLAVSADVVDELNRLCDKGLDAYVIFFYRLPNGLRQIGALNFSPEIPICTGDETKSAFFISSVSGDLNIRVQPYRPWMHITRLVLGNEFFELISPLTLAA